MRASFDQYSQAYAHARLQRVDGICLVQLHTDGGPLVWGDGPHTELGYLFEDVGRDPDQMPTPALARRADVIATPHVGGLTPQAAEHQALETVRQVAAIVKGRAPVGAVNAAQAARLARLA